MSLDKKKTGISSKNLRQDQETRKITRKIELKLNILRILPKNINLFKLEVK